MYRSLTAPLTQSLYLAATSTLAIRAVLEGSGFPLSANIVAEGSAAGTLIGTLSAREPGSWTPTKTVGWAPNAKVAIDGLALEASATPFDYDDGAEQVIKIDWTRASDGAVRTVSYPLTVQLVLVEPGVADLDYPSDAAVDDELSAVTGVHSGGTLEVISAANRIVADGIDGIKKGPASFVGDSSFYLRVSHPDASVQPHADFGPYEYAVTEAGGVLPVTWNDDPLKLGTDITLDVAKLVATNGGANAALYASALTNVGIDTSTGTGGKWRVEIKFNSFQANANGFGLYNGSYNINTNANSANRTLHSNGLNTVRESTASTTNAPTAYAPTNTPPTAGQWIALELDADVTPAQLYIKTAAGNRSQGFDCPSGIVYFFAMFRMGTSTTTATLNAGDDPTATNVGDDGALWFVPVTSGYLKLVGPAGGGGSAITVDSDAEMADALGQSYTTINVAPGQYGRLTISSRHKSPAVTIQALDEDDAPSFASYSFSNSSGYILSNLRFDGRDPVDGLFVAQIDAAGGGAGCSDITFLDCEYCNQDLIDNGVEPEQDGTLFGLNLRDSSYITHVDCHFHHLGGGWQQTNVQHTLFDGCAQEDIFLDDSSKNQRVLDIEISNAFVCNLQPLVHAAAHFDICQFFTTDDTDAMPHGPVKYHDNFYIRGSGAYAQGNPFIGNEAAAKQYDPDGNGAGSAPPLGIEFVTTFWTGVEVYNNMNFGGQFGGCSLYFGDGASIHDNVLQAYPDVGCNYTLSGNKNLSFDNNIGTGITLGVTNDFASNTGNNTSFPEVADPGAELVDCDEDAPTGTVICDLEDVLGSGMTYSLKGSKTSRARFEIVGTELVRTAVALNRARWGLHHVAVVGRIGSGMPKAKLVTITVLAA